MKLNDEEIKHIQYLLAERRRAGNNCQFCRDLEIKIKKQTSQKERTTKRNHTK